MTCCPAAERASFREMFPRILEGGTLHQELSIVATDGGTYWFRVDFAPVATEEEQGHRRLHFCAGHHRES